MRAAELIASNERDGLGITPGAPLEGYSRVALVRSDRWLLLAREARQHTAGEPVGTPAARSSRK